jgi:hypothetical protein
MTAGIFSTPPRPMKLLSVFTLAVGSLCFASCASVKKVGSSITAFSPSDLMPSRINVVAVREQDLQEITLGKERALAYSANKHAMAKRDSGLWGLFRGPVDFKEPTLPADTGAVLGEGLLPPKMN